MFDKHKAKKAHEQYEAALVAWQAERDELADILKRAETRSGDTSPIVVLKRGEAVCGSINGVGLIEMRRGAGHYAGRSSGISVPIGKVGGRTVRYRVGTSKGHYVQGAPHPQAVDIGTATITNQRIVFTGASKSLECAFGKLVSVQRFPGELSIAVSNRQKPTVLHYGSSLDDWVAMRLALALAMFNGEADNFADQMRQQLAELDVSKPVEPVSA